MILLYKIGVKCYSYIIFHRLLLVNAKAAKPACSGEYSMGKKPNYIILIVFLLVGIVADLFLLGGRMAAELDDRSVVAAAYHEDILRLSDESGLSEEQWLETLSAGGVRYIIFEDSFEQESLDRLAAFGMVGAALGDVEAELGGSWAFIIPEAGKPLPEMGDADLAIVKSEDRSHTILPSDFDIETYGGRMVKAIYAYPDYFNRYKEDVGTQEIENVLFRAITDRGARLLLLRPITYADYTPVLDPSAYAEMLGNVEKRIEERGYRFGENYSVLDTHVLSNIELWLTSLVPILIWVYLLSRFQFLSKFDPHALFALGNAAVVAAIVFMPALAQKLIALASVLGFSLCWVWLIQEHFILHKGKRLRPVRAYLLTLLSVLIWGFLGGLSVSAIQTDLSYMMGETIFSGVKLSMNLPVFVCAIVFALPILKRLKNGGFSKKQLLSMLPALLIVLAALAVLVHRSGQTDNNVSEFENRLRVAFEYAFYARPRTKEILVAVPFMSLLFVLHRRRDSMLHLIGGLCCGLECVSLINTFCHGVASLHVSLIRGSLSAIHGAILGIIIIYVINFLGKKFHFFPEGGSRR